MPYLLYFFNLFFSLKKIRFGLFVIRIQIQDLDPDPKPDPNPKLTKGRIRIRYRIRKKSFGSATLVHTVFVLERKSLSYIKKWPIKVCN